MSSPHAGTHDARLAARTLATVPGAAAGVAAGATVDVFTHPTQFPEPVKALFDAAEAEAMEFGSTWLRNLVDAVYPEHPGVRFYVLYQAGRPVAALPLLVEKGRLAQCATSLANYYSALYSPVVAGDAAADHLAELLRAVCRDNAPLASLRIAPMDPASRAHALLEEGLKRAGLAVFPFFCFGNWYQTVDKPWPAYLAERDGVLRSTIKRMGKKFANAGGRLELVQGGPELERGLAAYQDVYAASWKVPEPYQEFMPGLMRACAERGWLRLGVAWLDDKPVAVQLWIVACGKANIYKLAYHEEFKAFAPGTLLTAMLTQYAMETDNVAEIDYLIGDDPYKKSWMASRRERWGLMAYNRSSLAGFQGWCREVAGRQLRKLMPPKPPGGTAQTGE